MPISFELAERVLASNISKWMDRNKTAIDETVAQTIGVEGTLLSKMAKDGVFGGTDVREKHQFNRANNGRWVGLDEKLELGGTQGVTYSTVPMRTMRSAHFVAGDELEAEDDEETIINRIVEQAQQDVALFNINMVRDAWNARDGNYAHDGTSDHLAPFGWRHFLTIDGLHVSGSASTAVAGINASTQPLWKTPYINPVETSDGGRPITSGSQLRNCLDRAFRMLHYTGVSSWGKLGSAVKNVPETELLRKQNVGDNYVILMDGPAHDDYGAMVFDRMDNVGADQGFPVRTYRGVPMLWTEGLGTNSYGYGYLDDGTAAWTDRGGDYATGNWPSHSEVLVLSLKEWRFYRSSKSSPKVFPAYKPEGMDGLAYETKYRCGVGIGSRKRAGVYVGPFPRMSAA